MCIPLLVLAAIAMSQAACGQEPAQRDKTGRAYPQPGGIFFEDGTGRETDIGTVNLNDDAVLWWLHKGTFIRVTSGSKLLLASDDGRGRLRLKPGRYRLNVDKADGEWAISIRDP